MTKESAEAAFKQYDAKCKERVAEAMYTLGQSPAGLTALRDLVKHAHNPNHDLSIRTKFRLVEAGLANQALEDVRAALTIESDQVWLGEPAIHLGTTQTLSIPRVFNTETGKWETAELPTRMENSTRSR